MVPAFLMKDQPRSHILRSTLPTVGIVVCRKLHNERSRIACKHLCLLQDDTGADDRCDTKEVCRSVQPTDAPPKIAPCDHGDKRKLCTAGDEGGRHDCHTAVTLVFNRTGSHDTRNTAAGTDQHRDEGLTGKAELTEDTVHDEGDTCHVTASLQECKEDEQDRASAERSRELRQHRLRYRPGSGPSASLRNFTASRPLLDDTRQDPESKRRNRPDPALRSRRTHKLQPLP